MCLIVDANVAQRFFGYESEARPAFDWIDKRDGRLVYGGRNAEELLRVEKARRQLRTWLQAGRACSITSSEIENDEIRLRASRACVSNDVHVVALARVSGARVLYSNDAALHRDFKNRNLVSNPIGTIYQGRSHTRLLKHGRSCRFA